MFGTLQGRLAKELSLFGISDIDEANRYIREIYVPAHNSQFARPPQIAERAFVRVSDPASLTDILCIEQERIVARDAEQKNRPLMKEGRSPPDRSTDEI
jgi:hypothetical protein